MARVPRPSQNAYVNNVERLDQSKVGRPLPSCADDTNRCKGRGPINMGAPTPLQKDPAPSREPAEAQGRFIEPFNSQDGWFQNPCPQKKVVPLEGKGPSLKMKSSSPLTPKIPAV